MYAHQTVSNVCYCPLWKKILSHGIIKKIFPSQVKLFEGVEKKLTVYI